MRLVCPNCEAKYEVPDDAIPDSGRDVQCANCGHGWFQERAKPVAKAAPVAAVAEKPKAAEPAPSNAAEPGAETPAVSTPAVSTSVAPPQPEDDTSPAEDGGGEPEAGREPPPRVHDEKVLTILREEAEREARARREKTRPLEAQPDLGIDSATVETRKSRAKRAEPAPAPAPASAPSPAPQPEPEPEPEPEIELKVAARRDLLPDVEEIKTTLQPAEVEESEFASIGYGDQDRRERSGPFRSGFLTVITVAILAASVYISSGWLSAKVPALAAPLASYVAVIDDLRLQLDGLMRTATVLISGEEG